MKSIERVLTTLGHKEPDYVPVFMLFNLHGAQYHNVSIKEYYSKPELVASAQLHFQSLFGNDMVYTFHYASVEIEAFGGSVEFTKDGPPNAGEPFIKSFEDIDHLKVPVLEDCQSIMNVIEVTKLLNQKVGGEVLIVGVVMSPFSLPVMQLGFENYLKLKMNDPVRFQKLMDINKEFCINYANLQLAAGANAIVYFDPISSPTISTKKEFEEMGKPLMQEIISRINGPVACHYASGNVLPIIDDVIAAGAGVIGTGTKEDHKLIKDKARNKITILGNLNGIEMVRWSKEEVFEHVKKIISEAGHGGGFILSDSHGELPLQVSLQTIQYIFDAARKYGKYPLR